MYDEIVRKYYIVIYNYCLYKFFGNKTAAEDVTQEVFFTLYKKLNRLKMSENIKLWLYRTADIEIKEYLRKQPKAISYDELPEEILAADEKFPSLTESDLDCLTDEEKTLISDYYSGEEKEKIAKYNKISLNGLYIRIHRIRMKLLKNISKNDSINVQLLYKSTIFKKQ